MTKLLVSTNNEEIFNCLKQINFIKCTFPRNEEEIVEIIKNYPFTVFIIDANREIDIDIKGFYDNVVKIIGNIIRNMTITIGNVTIIIENDKKDYLDVESVEMINILIATQENVKAILNMLNILSITDFFNIYCFLNNLNGKIVFVDSLDIEKKNEITAYLGKQIALHNIKDEDIKIVMVYPDESFDEAGLETIFEYVKGINNYSDVDFISIKGANYKNIEVYCLYDKVKHLNVFTNIKDVIEESFYRYIKFVNTLDRCDICILNEKIKLPSNFELENNAKKPFLISVNPYNKVADVIISQKYLKNFLQLLEVFFSKRFEISMLDLMDILSVKGELVSYYKFYLNENEFMKQINDIVKSDSSIENVILFLSKPDLFMCADIYDSLRNIFPDANIIYFFPHRVYGEQEHFVEIFIFKSH